MAGPVTDAALLAQLNAPDVVAPAPLPTGEVEGTAPEITVRAKRDMSDDSVTVEGGNAVTDANLLAQLNSSDIGTEVSSSASNAIPTPRPEQSVIPHALDKFKQGAASLLGLAGAPVSILAGAMEVASNLAKGKPAFEFSDKEIFGGMGQVTRGYEQAFGVKKLKAPTDVYGNVSKTNEYIGTAAEFLGGSLFPGGSAVAMAERKLATAVVTILGTGASSTAAVEGKDIGGRLAESMGMPKAKGEEIGYMLGSIAGPKAIGLAGQAVVKGLNAGATQLAAYDVHGFGKEAQSVAASNMLRKEIVRSLELAPESPANIARAIALKAKIDQFSPNLAQMSDSPGIINMYRTVSNKSPEALAHAAEAERKNFEAIAAFKEKSFPTSGFSVTDPARVKLAADQSVLRMQADLATTKLEDLSNKFRTRADNTAIGEQLRTQYWQTRAAVKGTLDGELGQVYSTARKYNIQEDMTDVRQAVIAITSADKQTFQNVPAVFNKILTQYPAPVGTPSNVYNANLGQVPKAGVSASFEQLHSLKIEAGKEWNLATAAGDYAKAQKMTVIREMLDAKVAKYNSPEYGDLAQKFQAYNINYSKYDATFRKGAGGEIAARNRNGLATDAEDIINKVILGAGDKKRGVQDFYKMFGTDETAAALLHDGVLDNFSKSVMASGTLDPKAAQRWMYKHQAALSELPDLQVALGNTEKMASELVMRKAMAQAQAKVLDQTVLAKIAGTKVNETERMVATAIADPNTMRGLLVGAYTPEAKQSIARAIADSVSKRADSYDFLLKNEATLKPVMNTLGKDHWQNLKDLAEAEKLTARTVAPTAVELAKIQDIGEQVVGTSFKGLMQRVMAAQQGRVGTEYVIADVAGRFFYKARSEDLAKLREHAMFDTDTAELLAKMVKTPNSTRTDLLNLQAISFNAGLNSIAQAFEEKRRVADPEQKQVNTTRWGPGIGERAGGLPEKGKGRPGIPVKQGW